MGAQGNLKGHPFKVLEGFTEDLLRFYLGFTKVLLRIYYGFAEDLLRSYSGFTKDSLRVDPGKIPEIPVKILESTGFFYRVVRSFKCS